jgi:excisionase family DNA binding protein
MSAPDSSSAGGPAPLSLADEPLFSTGEAARLLGVSSKTVQNWVNMGHLHAARTPGGHRRITAAELDRALQSRDQARDFLVLVLEDDKAMARWYELAFDKEIADAAANIVVSVLQSGWQGLQRVLKSPPDLLITDLRMEPLSGFDLLSALAGMSKPVSQMQIVVVTGMSPAELRAAAPLPAHVKVLFKPVSLEQLRSCLGAAMRTRGLAAQVKALP